MATTTPNYGWDVPTSTDYVKDGATAIETLGDDIDATLYTALGGAYPGLRLVKKQTIGSGVTSVSVTNAFSSTYENYRILIQADSTNGGAGGWFRLDGITSQGVVLANYMSYGSSTITGFTQSSATNLAIIFNNAAGTPMTAQIDIQAPQAAKRKNGNFNSQGGNGTSNGNFSITSSVQATGFTIGKDSSETMTGGTIYVYGYGAS